MKILIYINVIFFILISTEISSCLKTYNSLSSDENQKFYIYMVPSLSKVFVSSSTEVKSIKYCFYDSECKDWKNESNFKLNKNKDRNIFELSNSNRFSKLDIESLSSESSSNDNITTDISIQMDIVDTPSNPESNVSQNESNNKVDNNENKVDIRRSVVLEVPRPTKGSGGKTGSYETNFSNNQMSSTYKVRVPYFYSPSDPAGLMIYLHGDSANDYDKEWLFKPVTEYVNGLNMISVAVKATSSGDGYFRWYMKPKLHGDYIHDLIENELFKKYNINKDRIYFTGTSGGSQFITGMIVSRYVSDYGGGAIPVCGGADIYSENTSGVNGMSKNITNTLLNGKFKIFYYTGQSDFLYNQTVKSKQSYLDLGVIAGSETYQGTGHCDKSVVDGVKRGIAFFEKK